MNNLARAVDLIQQMPGLDVLDASEIYRTEPQLVKEQPWFANQVVKCSCQLDPDTLLAQLKSIEESLGREAGERYGPRLIDLDILLYGAQRIESEHLQVPHPRLTERAFALVPLLDVNREGRLPDGSVLADHLSKIRYRLDGDIIYQD